MSDKTVAPDETGDLANIFFAAKVLGIAHTTLRVKLNKDEGFAEQIGAWKQDDNGPWLFSKSALREYLEDRTEAKTGRRTNGTFTLEIKGVTEAYQGRIEDAIKALKLEGVVVERKTYNRTSYKAAIARKTAAAEAEAKEWLAALNG